MEPFDPSEPQAPGAPRVLVAYGSRRGGTHGIAEDVAATLREDGCAVTLLPAARVGTVEPYDAVVLGGALYTYRWHKDARRFARRHARALAGRPVWLFSSGPLDHSAEEREIPPVRSAARAARRLHARGHTTFGGRLNADASGRIARSMAERGLEGDYRDPKHIHAWAHGIAAELADQTGTA
jgi:menaquinone-dependent protoporphyrinogen oxidase